MITAVGLAHGDTNRVYVGSYSGQVLASDGSTGPCEDESCWHRVGTGLPDAVVTSIWVDPVEPDHVIVTLSGFGIGDHVWESTAAGAASWWLPLGPQIAGVSIDSPANVIAVEANDPDNLWVGTDVGLFLSEDGGETWSRFTPSSGLPNVPVYDVLIDQSRGRVYAATHGRGVFVLTEPFIETLEGWVMGDIWDIPIYGYGFPPNDLCQVDLLAAGGTCASGTLDARGEEIRTDAEGRLVTATGSLDSRPVVWGCLNRSCVGPESIDDCTAAGVSSVRVTCDSGVVAFSPIRGECPPQMAPPSGIFGVSPSGRDIGPGPEARTLALDSGAVTLIAALQTGGGGSRVLCAANVRFDATETRDVILERAAERINTSSACSGEGVTASFEARMASEEEEDPRDVPRVFFSAPDASGAKIITGVRVAPGESGGRRFIVGDTSVARLRVAIILMTLIETAEDGAAGGVLTIHETSPLGMCRQEIPTFAGDTAAAIAARAQELFQFDRGPNCSARDNPADIFAMGDVLLSTVATTLEIGTTDPGVGFSVLPEELTPTTPPECGAATVDPARLWPPSHGMSPVTIAGITSASGVVDDISVTSVWQDEPVAGPGTHHAPDATIVSGDAALRAERSGGGDGRVYHLTFTATDDAGLTCDGEVAVCVPQSVMGDCVDEGALYDSTLL